MAFRKQHLQKFADLIKIEISDEKLANMNIDSVVEWLDKLQKIDTAGVTPMLSPSEHKSPMREDVVTDGNIRDFSRSCSSRVCHALLWSLVAGISGNSHHLICLGI